MGRASWTPLTPAMQAGITDRIGDIAELLG